MRSKKKYNRTNKWANEKIGRAILIHFILLICRKSQENNHKKFKRIFSFK